MFFLAWSRSCRTELESPPTGRRAWKQCAGWQTESVEHQREIPVAKLAGALRISDLNGLQRIGGALECGYATIVSRGRLCSRHGCD